VDRAELTKKINEAWVLKYPNDQKPIEVTEIVEKAFGGSLAAIRSKEADGTPNEEMIYVFQDGTVRIFNTTDEMVRFLQQKSREF